MPRAQPGESVLSHFSKTLSTCLAWSGGRVCACAKPEARKKVAKTWYKGISFTAFPHEKRLSLRRRFAQFSQFTCGRASSKAVGHLLVPRFPGTASLLVHAGRATLSAS